jgi:hypothetical protein
MEELTFNHQIIFYDRETTSNIYRARTNGSAEHDCAMCRNFRRFRDKIYNSETLSLLAKLGIDPIKESEAYILGDDTGQTLPYLVHFGFVGKMSASSREISDQVVGDLGGSPIFTTNFDPALRGLFGSQTLVASCFVDVPKAPQYDAEI